jgi:preprotein translocase subunit SecY
VLGTFRDAFKIPELKNRILFTLMIIAVYRIGCHIPTPGINGRVLSEIFSDRAGVLAFADLFTGGALSRATILALGIMPYISASIIFNLLTPVVPYLEKLSKEGEEGRKKITQYTRYGTIAISMVQSLMFAVWLEGMQGPQQSIVLNPGIPFKLLTMLTFTTGAGFVMWLGEQISERGIGNGMSLIIYTSIVSRMPMAFGLAIRYLRDGVISPFVTFLLVMVMVVVIAGVIVLTQAQRRIPVQYPRQVKGRRVYGGQKSYLPLRVNQAGVIPIIFASAMLMMPGMLSRVITNTTIRTFLMTWGTRETVAYNAAFAVLIILFCYFYTAITFNPVDIADNMKRFGGFVPGVRPGKATAEHLDYIMTRVTFAGAFALAAVATFPAFIQRGFNIHPTIANFFGGTGLLILVGVALDTVSQMESHLLMRHYDGFMKKGRIRGRR